MHARQGNWDGCYDSCDAKSKGYEAKLFHGEVVGLSDMITFQGKSIEELA